MIKITFLFLLNILKTLVLPLLLNEKQVPNISGHIQMIKFPLVNIWTTQTHV